MVEEISPMKLAKELGVRPQLLYGLIRKNRINHWTDARGKVVVGREEATKALSTPMKRGPKTNKVTAHDVEGAPAPVRVGDIVSWRTPKGVRVAQVKSQDDPFNFLEDLWGKQVFFRNHSLAKRLEEGVAKIERPVELLKAVTWQLLRDGKPHLAAQLTNWIVANEGELGDRTGVEVDSGTATGGHSADEKGQEVDSERAGQTGRSERKDPTLVIDTSTTVFLGNCRR